MSDNLKIRIFDPYDLERVAEISKKSLSEHYADNLFIEIYQSWPEAFLIGEWNDQIVAFMTGRRMTRTDARILMFAVDEKFRSHGIGTILINRFIEVCKSEMIITVRLEVRTDNARGIKFYQKNGFEVTSILRNYYSDGSDAYIMSRQII